MQYTTDIISKKANIKYDIQYRRYIDISAHLYHMHMNTETI